MANLKPTIYREITFEELSKISEGIDGWILRLQTMGQAVRDEEAEFKCWLTGKKCRKKYLTVVHGNIIVKDECIVRNCDRICHIAHTELQLPKPVIPVYYRVIHKYEDDSMLYIIVVDVDGCKVTIDVIGGDKE